MGIIKKLDRKLTDIFKRTGRRDAMLADLYAALHMERYNRLVYERAGEVAYLYWDSPEVGQCIGAAVDFIELTEGPGRAIELCKFLIRHVQTGSVFEHVLGKMGPLQSRKATEEPARKDMSAALNRIRMNASGQGVRVMNTTFCFREDNTRYELSLNRPTSLSPADFMQRLRR